MAFFRFNPSSHGHHHLVYGSSSCGATLQQRATTIGFGIRRPTTTTCALRFSARTKMDVGLGRRRRVIIFGAARSPTPGDLSRVQSQTLNGIAQEDEEKVSGKGLVSSHGWRVRDASRFDTEELRAVAHIQASSFHLQTAVFDQLFFKLFKAELLSALLYKARQSPPNRYACLLAEPVPEVDQEHLDKNRELKVVGAVNLTALVDSDVLRHLQGAHEYLYVSGMAVDADYRRQNVATLLLKACDLRAADWEFDWLVLHAYEDDVAARSLYSRAGYRVIAADPLWMTTWAGRNVECLWRKGLLVVPPDPLLLSGKWVLYTSVIYNSKTEDFLFAFLESSASFTRRFLGKVSVNTCIQEKMYQSTHISFCMTTFWCGKVYCENSKNANKLEVPNLYEKMKDLSGRASSQDYLRMPDVKFVFVMQEWSTH